MLLLRQARSYRRDYVSFLQRGLGQGKLRPAALTDSKAFHAAREALAKEEPQLREALQRARELEVPPLWEQPFDGRPRSWVCVSICF